MTKIINITVPADDWVNVNTTTGIAAGKQVTLQNDGVVWIRIQESPTKPTTTKEGKLLTNLDKASSNALVLKDSDFLWAISSVEGRGGRLAVQEV